MLYINDISICIKHSKINHLTDDTLLYIRAINIEEGIAKFNEDLNHILNWLNMNRLMLNV